MLYSQKTFGVAIHVSRFLSFSSPLPPPHLSSFFFLIACPSRSRVIRPRGKEEQREQFRFQYFFFLFFQLLLLLCFCFSFIDSLCMCVCVCRKNDTTTSEWIALNTSPRSRPLSDEALCDDNEIENPFR